MAKPTRFPFGFALGFENQFNGYGYGAGNPTPGAGVQFAQTAGLLEQAGTGPNVSMGSIFYTNNSSATVISLLRTYQVGRAGALQASGQIDPTSPPPEGKIIRIMFLDGNTQFAQGGSGGIGNIILSTSDNMLGGGSITDFMASNGSWYQIGQGFRVTGSGGTVTFVTNAQSSLSMDGGVKLALLNNTGGTTNSIIALSGGYVGQEVSFALVGSNAVRFITGGNLFMSGTNAALVNASGIYKFVNVGGSPVAWRMLAINSGGSI